MVVRVVSCCFMLFLCSVQMQGRCLNGQGHTLVFHRLEQAHGSNCISHLDTGLKHKRSYCTVLSPGIEHASSDTLKIACDLYLSVASVWPSSDLCPQKEQLCPKFISSITADSFGLFLALKKPSDLVISVFIQGWLDGWKRGCMDACSNDRMDGCMDGCPNARTDGACPSTYIIPVVPQKAVAEVSKIGNL